MRRGSNGVAPGRIDAVPTELELAALDDLGPQCRRIIDEGPLPTLAYSIISQVIEYNEKVEAENEKRARMGLPLQPYLDPREPRFDAMLATGVLEYSLKLMLEDRTPEHAEMGLSPLKPKMSARTARERRKTEGRRFRGW